MSDTTIQRWVHPLNGVRVNVGDTMLMKVSERKWILAQLAYDESDGRYYAIDQDGQGRDGERVELSDSDQAAALHPAKHTSSGIWGLEQGVPWWVQGDPPTSRRWVIALLASQLYDAALTERGDSVLDGHHVSDYERWDGGWLASSLIPDAAPDAGTHFATIPRAWQDAYCKAAKDALECVFLKLLISRGKPLTPLQVEETCEALHGRWLSHRPWLGVDHPLKKGYYELASEHQRRYHAVVKQAYNVTIQVCTGSIKP